MQALSEKFMCDEEMDTTNPTFWLSAHSNGGAVNLIVSSINATHDL